jgi:hypothetical protein
MRRNSNVLSAVGACLLLFLTGSCAHDIPPSGAVQDVWMTHANYVPHGMQQRVGIFVGSEIPAIVVSGFPTQRVTVSIHDDATGRLLIQSEQFTHTGTMGFRLAKPLGPGHYVVRASQDGTLKCQSTFSVR